MPWSNTQFNLADLRIGDEIEASGDDFDARLTVIREGDTPGCTMFEAESDPRPRVVQIIGHGIYSHDITDHSTFVRIGAVGGGGQIMLGIYNSGAPEIRTNSLTRWKVRRGGEIIYNRGETQDDSGDPEVPTEED